MSPCGVLICNEKAASGANYCERHASEGAKDVLYDALYDFIDTHFLLGENVEGDHCRVIELTVNGHRLRVIVGDE